MNSVDGDDLRRAKRGARVACGLVTVALGAAVFGLSPLGEALHGSVAATDADVAAPVPYAPALTARTLERAPLVQVRLRGEDEGCCSGGHAYGTPCAMYAPGYKPKTATEDTPHLNFRSNFVLIGTGIQWPQPNGKGTALTVTYSFSNLLDGGMRGVTAAQLKAGVQEALRLWSAVTPLTFKEINDSGPTPSDSSYTPGSAPNIRYGHHTIDGPSQVLAHAYPPFDIPGDGLSGDVHFDETETWVVKPSGAKIDFIEVCVHETGHALGLDHSVTPPAIMGAFYGGYYSGPGTAFIYPDDRNGIQAIYGPKPTTIPTPTPPTPIPTPTPTATVVTVAFNAATKALTLTGDGSANGLTISRSGTTLTLTAATGTTLSYQGTKKTTQSFLGVTGKISINGTLGSGSDSLTCTSLDVSTLQLDLSGGNDSVVLNLCNVDRLDLAGGSGTDTYVGTTSRVTLNVSTGFP